MIVVPCGGADLCQSRRGRGEILAAQHGDATHEQRTEAGAQGVLGLLAIVAAVAYGAATFVDLTLSSFSTSWADGYSLTRVFLIFIGVLAVVTVLSIFSSHLLAIFNSISVWWHVFGVAAIIATLVFAPQHHAGLSEVFTQRINNTGFFGGHTFGAGFLFLVLPLSVIFPQFTVTGYDASCHMSEETVGASDSAAKGIWQAILYSGIGGWLLLLSMLFAVRDSHAVSASGGNVMTVLDQALPSPCVMLVAALAIVLTLPALVQVDINGAPVPVAFNAVVSIGVVGVYLAFAIPIYQRLRAGSAFEVGTWSLGRHYVWLGLVAVVEIGVTTVIAVLPTSPGGVPWNAGFSWKYVNYTPLVVGGTLLALWLAWELRMKNTYTGPRTTVDAPLEVAAR